MSNVIDGGFGPNKTHRMKAVSYVRDFESTRNLSYEQKFASLLTICEDAASGKYEAVIIAYPQVLGDSYEEVMINLQQLAKAGLLVAVAGTSPGIPIQ
ncbi:MAG: hypothetical protein ABSG53_02520 [Thermoguttaceae bacterium]|jgi:hypothetical protein